MYVRFEGPRGGGLFWVASEGSRLLRRLRMSRSDARKFTDLKSWLWTNTPVPGAGAYQDWRSRHPRTWFKECATEHVRLAWELSDLLCRHGVRIRPLRTRAPGTILWEDQVQVIVRPRRINTRPPRPRPVTTVERRPLRLLPNPIPRPAHRCTIGGAGADLFRRTTPFRARDRSSAALFQEGSPCRISIPGTPVSCCCAAAWSC
jgi:hypothetical protein